jgi:antitoxin MazE
MSGRRAQIVKWGNSQAVRIPKPVLDQAQMRAGDEVEIRVEEGRIAIEPVNTRLTLESLISAITPENRPRELEWGKPVGNEVW